MNKSRVLVHLPVYNEEKTVRNVIDEIAQLYPDWDIVAVDDKSTDNTVSEILKTKARFVPLLVNTKGVGPDLTSFLIALKENYDYLFKIDADGQQEPKLLKELYLKLKNQEGDIVVGSRYIKKVKETDSFIKVIGRVVTSAMINFKIGKKNTVTDCTSGIRAWNKKSLSVLVPKYMEYDLSHDTIFWIREAIIASKNNLKICEVPAYYHAREFGESKSFSLRNMITFPIRFLIILVS